MTLSLRESNPGHIGGRLVPSLTTAPSPLPTILIYVFFVPLKIAVFCTTLLAFSGKIEWIFLYFVSYIT